LNSHIQQEFYGLDHLRALAIAFVFLFHYFILSKGQPEWLPDFASFGWTGVDLFFVLSGFLIASQLFVEIKQRQTISIKNFYLKRFFRIVPIFLFTVALYFCFPILREKEQLPALWKFLSFTQNFDLNIKDFGTFSHAWSLCVEEHFYLFLPLTLLLLLATKGFKNSYWLIIVFIVFGFAIRIYSFNHFYMPKINEENSWMYWYKYIYYPTYNRLDGLLIGISIAAIYNFSPIFWSKISVYGNHFIILSLAILTAAYFLCEDQMTFAASIFGFPLIAIGYGFLVMGALSPSSFLFKWKSKYTSFIASISYAIYLTHKSSIHLTNHLLKSSAMDTNIILLISVITSIGVAYLLHLIIEKPFMKMRNNIIKLK
jgi:peptidoglycan/LPS O-acetylase OafA/YrhL